MKKIISILCLSFLFCGGLAFADDSASNRKDMSVRLGLKTGIHLMYATTSPYVLEMPGDEIHRDAPEIEALAAGQDRDGDLAWLGRREDELHVRRWLFEGLEQRVEGRGGQHVHLVDDNRLIAPAGGPVAQPLAKIAHVIDARIGRSVDFQNVRMGAPVDLLAR